MEGGEKHAIDKKDAMEGGMDVEGNKDIKVHIIDCESSRLIFNGHYSSGVRIRLALYTLALIIILRIIK